MDEVTELDEVTEFEKYLKRHNRIAVVKVILITLLAVGGLLVSFYFITTLTQSIVNSAFGL